MAPGYRIDKMKRRTQNNTRAEGITGQQILQNSHYLREQYDDYFFFCE